MDEIVRTYTALGVIEGELDALERALTDIDNILECLNEPREMWYRVSAFWGRVAKEIMHVLNNPIEHWVGPTAEAITAYGIAWISAYRLYAYHAMQRAYSAAENVRVGLPDSAAEELKEMKEEFTSRIEELKAARTKL